MGFCQTRFAADTEKYLWKSESGTLSAQGWLPAAGEVLEKGNAVAPWL